MQKKQNIRQNEKQKGRVALHRRESRDVKKTLTWTRQELLSETARKMLTARTLPTPLQAWAWCWGSGPAASALAAASGGAVVANCAAVDAADDAADAVGAAAANSGAAAAEVVSGRPGTSGPIERLNYLQIYQTTMHLKL